MRDAFEQWALEHPWPATFLGVFVFAGITAAGLVAGGQEPAFAAGAATAVAVTTIGMFALAWRLSGRPVMFGLFGGGGRSADGTVSPYHAPEGWSAGGDGGGGG